MTWHKGDPGVFAQYRSPWDTCVQGELAHRRGRALYGFARLLSWRDGSGVSAFQSAAFVLGQSAPHARVIAGLHGPAQTGRHDLTATADDFGLFGLENRGIAIPDRKEQLRVLVQTGSAISPRHEDCAPTEVLKRGIARVISGCASFRVTVLLRCHW